MSAITNSAPASTLSSTASNPASTTSGLSGTVSPVQAAVGPVSGINYSNLIQALVASQARQVTDLQNNIQTSETKQGDYQTLSANLTTLATALQTLGQSSTFLSYL